MTLFKKYIKASYFKFIGVIGLLLLSVGLSTPFPYFSKLIIDDLNSPNPHSNISEYILVLIGLIIIQVIIGRLASISIAKYFQKLLAAIRSNIFSKKILVCEESRQSKISTIIFNDTELYVNSLENILACLITNVGLFLGYLIFLFQINCTLTLVIILIIPIYIFWIQRVGIKLKKLSRSQQENRDKLLSILQHFFSGIETVKVFSLFKRIKKNYIKVVEDNYNTNTKLVSFQNFIAIISTAIISSTSILIFLLGVKLVQNGELTIGSLIAFNSYSSLIFSPITQLVNILATIAVLEVYENRITEYLSVTDVKEDKQFIRDEVNKIELKNFNLYLEEPCLGLIYNCNLTLNQGQKILVLGENGVGKSLLLKSISNLYTIHDGKIIFKTSNKDYILSKDIQLTPNNIVYISSNQDFIFDKLRDEINVEFTKTDELSQLIKRFKLAKKFKELENGLDTSMEFIKNNWSLGELQKLRIIRALSYHPNFLILDEILSNIDIETYNNILDSITSLYPKICIVITEHHKSINKVDKIFQISNKKVEVIN